MLRHLTMHTEHLRANIRHSNSPFPSDLMKCSSCLDESLSTIPTGALLRESTDYYYFNRMRNLHIQIMACQVVHKLHKFDHVSEWMSKLHWLKIQERITYKIATLVHQCKTGSAPQYLMDLLPNRSHQHIPRSSTSDNMQPFFCKTSLALKGSSSSVEPRIWNSLTPSLKAERDIIYFKKSLKTHLFKLSYRMAK